MSKKSKKNKRGRRPPLSLLDKSIYWNGIILTFILLSLLFGCGFEDITGAIAFQDSSVVAYASHATFLFVMPLALYIEISSVVFCIVALEGKKPIFGNKKIEYGESPWAKDCFPLFDSRRKAIPIRPAEKRFRRHMLILWSVGLLLCSMIAPLGIFGRDCLTQDNSIITYNVLNEKDSTPFTTDDFDNLTIQAKYVSGYRIADYWKFEIIIQMKDGTSFAFSNQDFAWRTHSDREVCLKKMLEIKSFFTPDSITIKGERNIEKVVNYFRLNAEQKQLLQELFQ